MQALPPGQARRRNAPQSPFALRSDQTAGGKPTPKGSPQLAGGERSDATGNRDEFNQNDPGGVTAHMASRWAAMYAHDNDEDQHPTDAQGAWEALRPLSGSESIFDIVTGGGAALTLVVTHIF